MGASKEKRSRQQESFEAFGHTNEESERLKAQKTKRTTIIVIIAVIVCFLAALFINSRFIRRNFTAVTAGDHELSVTEFNYFYYSAYYNYYSTIQNYYGSYASSLLPSTSTPLSNQVYDSSTGETWADYFESLALENIAAYYSIYDAAMAAGYALSDDDQAELDSEYASIEDGAKSAGYSDVNKYLEKYYGRGMTLDYYKECAGVVYVAGKYQEYYYNSLEFTDDEIAVQRDSVAGAYDQFEYRYFYIAAADVDESQYEGDDEGLEAAKAEALDAAKLIAEGYYEEIKSEEDLISAAKEYDSDTYAEEDSTYCSYLGNKLSTVYGDWLKDDSRKSGDLYLAESTSGYYLVYFLNRDYNDYETQNLRLIKISPNAVDSEEYSDDDAYNEAVQEALKAAETKTQTLYQSWLNSGGTEDMFIEYAKENSADTADGGLYENVHKGQFSDALNDWCYDASRVTGDSAVISSEEDNCCYILYYIGPGKIYSDYLAESDLRSDAYDKWYDETSANLTADTKWLFTLAE